MLAYPTKNLQAKGGDRLARASLIVENDSRFENDGYAKFASFVKNMQIFENLMIRFT